MNWHATLSSFDARLVDDYQSGFPIRERPYEIISAKYGLSETRLLKRIRDLHREGIFRRIGPVFNPPVIGSSALVAANMSDDRLQADVAEDKFQESTAIVNEYDQVNHNYRREHRWNMWFVITAPTLERRTELLDEIERSLQTDLLRLPMETEYYIDMEFPVVNEDSLPQTREPARHTVEPTRIDDSARVDLTDLERQLVLELQEGFPLSRTPYRDVAASMDQRVEAVLGAIETLRDKNCIKRIGCIVDHHAVGFDANSMVVWDVPDDELDERAVEAGRSPGVTYCCHRPRRPELGWSYNLFTMIHGRSRAAVEDTIDELATEHLQCDHARLHTVEVLKQAGVRYQWLLSPEPVATTHE